MRVFWAVDAYEHFVLARLIAKLSTLSTRYAIFGAAWWICGAYIPRLSASEMPQLGSQASTFL
jgi:hypothetical protein